MEYSAESLRYLSDKSRVLATTVKTLLQKQASLTQLHYSTMSNWVHELASSLFPQSLRVPQLTISYLYMVLSRVSLKSDEILDLLCWISMSLACKIEGKTFLVEDIQRALDNRYSASAIITTERYFTEQLDWNFTIPTAHEIIEILVASGIPSKLKRVQDVAVEYSPSFYANPSYLALGSFPIAIASIIKAMLFLQLGEESAKFLKNLACEFYDEVELAKSILA